MFNNRFTWSSLLNAEQVYKFLVQCPECGVEVQLATDAEQGELLTCDSCGLELEVHNGGLVKFPMSEGEDWGE